MGKVEYNDVLQAVDLHNKDMKWNRKREQTKRPRRLLTDTIKDFLIPHAKSQGSKSYKLFYVTYSNLLNSVFIDSKNITKKRNQSYRDFLPTVDLEIIARLEHNLCEKMICEVEAGKNYKEIYKSLKAWLLVVVEGIGQAELMMPIDVLIEDAVG